MEFREDYVSFHYEVDIGNQHRVFLQEELEKIVESEEECKKIRVVSKAYTYPDIIRWIVLFGDDTPQKDKDGKLYYWTYSNERYGTQVMHADKVGWRQGQSPMDETDEKIMQRWLNVRLPILNSKK